MCTCSEDYSLQTNFTGWNPLNRVLSDLEILENLENTWNLNRPGKHMENLENTWNFFP